MPIPHEVTKQFFIPTEEMTFMGEDFAINNNDNIEQRINDLFLLFNLFDSAFGQRNRESTSNTNEENSSEHDQINEHESSEIQNSENEENESTNEQNHQRGAINNDDIRELEMLRTQLVQLRQRLRNQSENLRQMRSTEDSN